MYLCRGKQIGKMVTTHKPNKGRNLLMFTTTIFEKEIKIKKMYTEPCIHLFKDIQYLYPHLKGLVTHTYRGRDNLLRLHKKFSKHG